MVDALTKAEACHAVKVGSFARTCWVASSWVWPWPREAQMLCAPAWAMPQFTTRIPGICRTKLRNT